MTKSSAKKTHIVVACSRTKRNADTNQVSAELLPSLLKSRWMKLLKCNESRTLKFMIGIRVLTFVSVHAPQAMRCQQAYLRSTAPYLLVPRFQVLRYSYQLVTGMGTSVPLPVIIKRQTVNRLTWTGSRKETPTSPHTAQSATLRSWTTYFNVSLLAVPFFQTRNASNNITLSLPCAISPYTYPVRRGARSYLI